MCPDSARLGSTPQELEGRDAGFQLELLTAEKSDVYLSVPHERHVPWRLVRRLDRDSVRVLTDMAEPDPCGDRARRIIGGCAGFIGLFADHADSRTSWARTMQELSYAAELGLPLALLIQKGVPLARTDLGERIRLQLGADEAVLGKADQLYGPAVDTEVHDDLEGSAGPLSGFQHDLLVAPARPRPYAFLIGRLERDFSHAREAVRAAVEREAGIPCLWSDDGRHRSNISSVRETTRLLIRNASFIVADLTLGVESPDQENPSRAHEIGMAIAYERELLLCSQEPRRYPYFSIGDMQMTFWATEAELASSVAAWVRTHRQIVGRRVLNHDLPSVYPGYEARIAQPEFHFDPRRRFVGPRTHGSLRSGAPRFWSRVLRRRGGADQGGGS